jgi:putative protein-disulfide isomerase
MKLQFEKLEKINKQDLYKADSIEITYYTDPLCCWSWGFEPQWRKLQYQLKGNITVRYVMSGLLPSWKNYNDPLFSVSRPLQMGPVWLEASRLSGMRIHDRLWVEDPPASSYPACIAVKCAELQSVEAGEKYLRLSREAVMLHGRNIAKQEVLVQLAIELEAKSPGLIDIGRFVQELTNNNGIEAFRKDWQDVQNRGINRFPTLIIKAEAKQPIMITGYRPYPVLLDGVKQMLTSKDSFKTIDSAEEYKQYWGSITLRELEELNA